MKKLLVFALGVAVVLATSTIAGIPQMINYQGRLTDTGGVPATGLKYMQFKIYDASTGGNILWSNLDGLEEVQVTDGLFSYLLGATRPLPDSLKKYDSLWLGIRVSPDLEMTPRTRLTSVNFAYKTVLAENALNARHADTASFADRALKSDTATFANIAIVADSASRAGHSVHADTAAFVSIPLYYGRLAADTIGGTTGPYDTLFVQKSATLTIPPNKVTKYIVVTALTFNFVNANMGGAATYQRIVIGSPGAEAVRDERNLLAGTTANHIVTSSNTVQYYYEPSDLEKANGFDVKLYLKIARWSNGSAYSTLVRLEVFGM